MPLSKDLVAEIVKSIDADGSGYITPDELLTALDGTGIDLDAVKQFIAATDENSDGKLSLQELEDFLLKCLN